MAHNKIELLLMKRMLNKAMNAPPGYKTRDRAGKMGARGGMGRWKFIFLESCLSQPDSGADPARE